MHLLNNIGIIGAILAAVADIIFVMIMVFGVQIDVEMTSMIIFAVVNALIGILINVLLRYQGQKYAEIENEDLCNRFHNKQVREKKYLSMGRWMTLKTIEDFLIKGITTSFSIFGLIYISVAGSKNPIQILITVATLILFACFGLMGMNSSYCRFYNVQIPFMEMKIDERETQISPTNSVQGVMGEDGEENAQKVTDKSNQTTSTELVGENNSQSINAQNNVDITEKSHDNN